MSQSIWCFSFKQKHLLFVLPFNSLGCDDVTCFWPKQISFHLTRARPVSRSICWDLGALWPQEDPLQRRCGDVLERNESVSPTWDHPPKNGGFVEMDNPGTYCLLQFDDEMCFVIW